MWGTILSAGPAAARGPAFGVVPIQSAVGFGWFRAVTRRCTKAMSTTRGQDGYCLSNRPRCHCSRPGRAALGSSTTTTTPSPIGTSGIWHRDGVLKITCQGVQSLGQVHGGILQYTTHGHGRGHHSFHIGSTVKLPRQGWRKVQKICTVLNSGLHEYDHYNNDHQKSQHHSNNHHINYHHGS